jgi:hypothetical protein
MTRPNRGIKIAVWAVNPTAAIKGLCHSPVYQADSGTNVTDSSAVKLYSPSVPVGTPCAVKERIEDKIAYFQTS